MTRAEREEAIRAWMGFGEAVRRQAAARREVEALTAALDDARRAALTHDLAAAAIMRAAAEQAAAPMPAPEWVQAFGFTACLVRVRHLYGRRIVEVTGPGARMLEIWVDSGVQMGEQVAALVADFAAWERRNA